jgi:hypothetical protein
MHEWSGRFATGIAFDSLTERHGLLGATYDTDAALSFGESNTTRRAERTEMKTVKENLIAAKALIDTPRKWAKGDGYAGPSKPCLCIISSVAEVAEGRDFCAATEALEAVLAPVWGDDDGLQLARFNDHPRTTLGDVDALFDRAITAQDEAP